MPTPTCAQLAFPVVYICDDGSVLAMTEDESMAIVFGDRWQECYAANKDDNGQWKSMPLHETFYHMEYPDVRGVIRCYSWRPTLMPRPRRRVSEEVRVIHKRSHIVIEAHPFRMTVYADGLISVAGCDFPEYRSLWGKAHQLLLGISWARARYNAAARHAGGNPVKILIEVAEVAECLGIDRVLFARSNARLVFKTMAAVLKMYRDGKDREAIIKYLIKGGKRVREAITLRSAAERIATEVVAMGCHHAGAAFLIDPETGDFIAVVGDTGCTGSESTMFVLARAGDVHVAASYPISGGAAKNRVANWIIHNVLGDEYPFKQGYMEFNERVLREVADWIMEHEDEFGESARDALAALASMVVLG